MFIWSVIHNKSIKNKKINTLTINYKLKNIIYIFFKNKIDIRFLKISVYRYTLYILLHAWISIPEGGGWKYSKQMWCLPD